MATDHIAEIATSWRGDRVAVVRSSGTCSTWSLRSKRKIAEFEVAHSSGGRRIVITPDGKHVISAAYNSPGLACYSANSGKLSWQRPELKRTQRLALDRHGSTLFVNAESTPARSVSVATGRDSHVAAGVVEAVLSPINSARFLVRRGRPSLVVYGGRKSVIERESFAYIAFGFSKRSLMMSEAGGPVRCITLADGNELWRWTDEPFSDATRIAYCDRAGAFVALARRYDPTDLRSSLVHVDPGTGFVRTTITLPGADSSNFCAEGTRLLLSSGELIDTQCGKVVGRLALDG